MGLGIRLQRAVVVDADSAVGQKGITVVKLYKRRFARIGPITIEPVPINKFEKRSGKDFNHQLEELWSIIGPSVELNMQRLPLWKVIAMAYFEGAIHATQMLKEEDE